jgi:hypothetical protein
VINHLFLPDSETRELVRLATARYKKTRPELAIDFLLSDRRAAKLGALDERKRRTNTRVSHKKFEDPISRRICYRTYIASCMTFDPPDMHLVTPNSFDGSGTITARFVAPVSLGIDFDKRDLFDQRGRSYVARQLRRMRARAQHERGL